MPTVRGPEGRVVPGVTRVRVGRPRRRGLPLYFAAMATRSNHKRVSRRGVLKKAAAAAAVSVSVAGARRVRAQAAAPQDKSQFVLCLNTSTIRGQKLPLPQEIELAAKAGFTAIEPWVGEINDYVK